MSRGRETVANQLRAQAHYCGVIGSPLYAHLLERAADDVLAGGPAWAVLDGHEADPPLSMLPLRFLGAVHRAVLEGKAPGLAAFFPSVGGVADLERVWEPFREVVMRMRDDLRVEVEAPVQTNEVARSAGLLGGFLLVAERTGLPLRVLEVGASAGLIMRWDAYHYSSQGVGWGRPDSPVRFEDFVASGRFPFHVDAMVAERAGCDAAPLDPSSERDSLTVRGFVWPDQAERFETLSAALELAREHPVPVERADAGEWCERVLRDPRPGLATVVYHSLVMQYLGEGSRTRMVEARERAGAQATADAPLAWLRMELGGDEAEVRLITWPGGEDAVIARAHYHGRPVRWLAG